MTPDALATALAALERERSPAVAVTSPSPVSSRLHGQPHGSTTATQYYATPSMPIKWRLSESYVSEDDIPLNLGAEKLPNDEEGHWGAHGFKLPRRTNTHYQRAPRRNGLEVDWDCGICLEPAANPCVTRCGHLFCERDLRMWFRSKPTELRCPVCSAVCVPDRDIVPIFGRGANAQAAPPPTFMQRQDLPVVGSHPRSRHIASRSHSMEESDTMVEPPSLTTSALSSPYATPTPSGTATPALLPEDRDSVVGLLYPKAHPLFLQAMVSRELGRLLSLLGFVALMIFLIRS